MAHIQSGRNEKTTFCIVDAQSVKNTDTAQEKGYDAGKKVSSIKCHLAVDTQGLPHALAVTPADVTDRTGALVAFTCYRDNLSEVVNVLADGAYTGEPFAVRVRARNWAPRLKLLSVTNCTPSLCCLNVGLSNVPFPGSKNVASCGKIVSVH